jgi:predicted RNase H-like HicB family nuclease
MRIEWSDEDDLYVVTVPDLPGCRTHGATRAEAVRQGEDAIASWVDSALEEGSALPTPRLFDAEKSPLFGPDIEALVRVRR